MPIGIAEQIWAEAAAAAIARRRAANTPWPACGSEVAKGAPDRGSGEAEGPLSVAEGQEAWPEPRGSGGPALQSAPVIVRMPLREARIIVPAEDLHAGRAFSNRLIEAFGGYTCMPGRRGWRANDGIAYYDYILVFDVAMEATAENNARLREIARWALRAFDQQAIYIRLPGGTVEFVS